MRQFLLLLAISMALIACGPDLCHAENDLTPAGSFTVRIEKIYNATQGHLVDVAVKMDTVAGLIGGFDFLIAFYSPALTFMEAEPGDYLADCGWEYFACRYLSNADSGGVWPSDLIRLTGLADDPGNADLPDTSCIASASGRDIARLTFYISRERNWECWFLPIQFYWTGCRDNSLSSWANDTLFVNQAIYDVYNNRVDNPNFGFPGYFGITDSCLQGDTIALRRSITFINGGVDVSCGIYFGFVGDINNNGIKCETADAALFIEYFVEGLAAFKPHIEGSIVESDVNLDGYTLGVADLVYLIRNLVGDADPLPSPQPEDTARVIRDGNDVFLNSPTDLGAALLVFKVESDIVPQLHVDMNMIFGRTNDELRVLIYDMGRRVIPAGDNLVLTVPGATLIKAELGSYRGIRVASTINRLPLDFALSQNVPNPFNPKTKISLSLPMETDWSIEILNVTGQTIRKFTGHNTAGVVDIIWDGKDDNGRTVASGMYLYRAVAGDFSESRKMVLLK